MFNFKNNNLMIIILLGLVIFSVLSYSVIHRTVEGFNDIMYNGSNILKFVDTNKYILNTDDFKFILNNNNIKYTDSKDIQINSNENINNDFYNKKQKSLHFTSSVSRKSRLYYDSLTTDNFLLYINMA